MEKRLPLLRPRPARRLRHLVSQEAPLIDVRCSRGVEAEQSGNNLSPDAPPHGAGAMLGLAHFRSRRMSSATSRLQDGRQMSSEACLYYFTLGLSLRPIVRLHGSALRVQLEMSPSVARCGSIVFQFILLPSRTTYASRDACLACSRACLQVRSRSLLGVGVLRAPKPGSRVPLPAPVRAVPEMGRASCILQFLAGLLLGAVHWGLPSLPRGLVERRCCLEGACILFS